MPFWWRRRRKPWFGRWRQRRYTHRQTRRRRRFQRRWKRRRPYRRRRRRRAKVRRKKKKLTIQQWQPDSITTCKIKGIQDLVLGAEGSQFLCYTQEKRTMPPLLCPGGGGFGVERYTLQYLYYRHFYRENIWTKSNDYKDLCRYIRCKVTLFRHPTVDFIIQYSRQGPFNIDKYTYAGFHPQLMLLKKHHRVIPSLKTMPKGRFKLKLYIKPPKQMINKWFFQKQFADYDLFQIAASACTLSYPRISAGAENRFITIHYLNTLFFKESDWAHTVSGEWKPYHTIDTAATYWLPNGKQYHYTPAPSTLTDQQKYYYSIARTTGWFNTNILQATKVTTKEGTTVGAVPVLHGRYNPAEDDGKGNEVWLTAVTGDEYGKPQDQVLYFDNTPLWLVFYGYWSYIQKMKNTSYFTTSMFVIRSPYIYKQSSVTTNDYMPIVDWSFIQGKNQKNSPYSYLDEKLWYPTCWRQRETINQIVECGPFIPKLDGKPDSTWELNMKYEFVFKWGGPQIQDEDIKNPKQQNTYPVPDTIQETAQVANPHKQKAESMLQSWDFRRGFITNTALKRMSENLLTDSDFQTDSEGSQKRKRDDAELKNPEEKLKKIKTCLLSLCESTTSQESQEETPHNLLKLINKQRQQQQLLKHNILTLIKDMKEQQKMLQLQTGNLN
nr:MAG: ORF1 [Torque teno midi virus]